MCEPLWSVDVKVCPLERNYCFRASVTMLTLTKSYVPSYCQLYMELLLIQYCASDNKTSTYLGVFFLDAI